MKLNKKGMTLVEIIISIALISIVLVFLFSLLVDVKDMNDEASINSDYLINKALILKNIEEDLYKTTTELKINTCEIGNFYTTYDTYKNDLEVKQKAYECISFDFGDSKAYLGIYYYKNKNSYVISYIHGDTKATRLLPEFEKYNVDKDNGIIKSGFEIKYSNSSGTTKLYNEINAITLDKDIFHKIEIPIIGSDGKDYSILISYYKKS